MSKLYSFNLSGDLEWNISFNKPLEWGAITVGDDKTVYCAGGSNLYAVSIDGTIKWAKKFDRDIVGYVSEYKGRVYLATSTYEYNASSKLYALNSSDGRIVWIYNLPNKGYVGPYPPHIDEYGNIYIKVYLPNYTSLLLAINPDGNLKWKTYLGRGLADSLVAIDDSLSTVYVVGLPGFSLNEIVSIYASNGTVKWKIRPNRYPLGFVIGGDSNMYLYTDGGIYEISPNGTQEWYLKVRWNSSYGLSFRTVMSIGSNGVFYILTCDGIYAIGSRSNPYQTEIIIISSAIVILLILGVWRWRNKKGE